ncbi:MAG TPA: hypothetical protein VMX16_08385 [Terriglobia bacterium]|nr:hypothetical protein [Terriglobia bacterium]
MKFQKAILALFAIAFFSAISVLAQDTVTLPVPPAAGGVAMSGGAGGAVNVTTGAGGVVTMGFFSFGSGKTITGAPFSAQEVTTSVQSLSDGNQITRHNTVQIYRDSAGRVRREMTPSMIGPWSVSGKPKQIIVIQDPVDEVHYFLDPNKKIAYKMPIPSSENGKSSFRTMLGTPKAETQTQPLGVQMMQGLEAQGTEETITIPADAVGNQKPIVSTTEKWYSPDLQTYVLIKRDDPRFGNTTFQLQNISRNEPPASLFQVPAGYTVQNGPPRPPGAKGDIFYKSSN